MQMVWTLLIQIKETSLVDLYSDYIDKHMDGIGQGVNLVSFGCVLV